MNRIAYLYVFFVVCTAFLGITHIPVSAVFQQTYIRLDRQKALTSTSGTVCATPATSGTESKVLITFPSAFTVNTSTSVWTVSTAGIPQDGTAWPGIGTATDVTGHTVTFPSSDLTPGTAYCFRFTNSAALTNPAAAHNYNGTMATANASNATVDNSPYALAVLANDQVTVTASVLPSSNDLDFSMTSVPLSTTTLRENDSITFTVSYQSNYTTTTPLTIQASWEKGTVAGSGTQIDIFDYGIGSATTADDGTVPVVDPVNRTVTWDIAALNPSATPHTVSFSLSVRSSIPTQNQISSSVQAVASVESAQLHQEQLDFTIQATTVQPSPTATPAPTGIGPSATPVPPGTGTPAPPVTTTPTLPPAGAPVISAVHITEVSDTSAVMVVTTSFPTTYILIYGTDPARLDKTVTGLTAESVHSIELSGLLPGTPYYFSITVKNGGGQAMTSDIFTFRTAERNEPFSFTKDTMNVAFQQITLTDPLTESVLIPVNVPFTIHVKTPRAELVKEMYAKIQHNVLGITESRSPPPIEEVRLIEILPGIFSGDILSPAEKGIYTVLLTVYDIYGGIHTVTSPYRFVISRPITVVNGRSGQPVEGARVIIQKYEENLQTYTPLPKGLSMDIRTDERGELRVVLPRGKYLIDVSATGYQDSHSKLVIDAGTASYPEVSLTADSTISAAVRYIADAVIDTCVYVAAGTANALRSPRVRSAALITGELSLLAFGVVLLRIRRRMQQGPPPHENFLRWLSESLVIFLSDAMMIASLIALGFIIRYQGLAVSVPLILVTCLLFGLWIRILRDLWIMQTQGQ